jgi:hypothetical protein
MQAIKESIKLLYDVEFKCSFCQGCSKIITLNRGNAIPNKESPPFSDTGDTEIDANGNGCGTVSINCVE